MENRNGNVKVTGCSPLLKSARPIFSAARRSWRNTFSPSARAISAAVSPPASKIGMVNPRTRWRKRSSLRFSRKFWREKPEKLPLFRLGIDLGQGHAGFGEIERSAGQSRHDICEVRVVADENQNF